MTLKKIFCMFLITPVTPVTQFNKYLLTDSYIITIKCFILVLAVLFLIITLDYIIDCSSFFDFELKEFSLIIGFSVFFMLFLVSSIDLFGMYVCLEGLSFSLYILAGMNAFSKSSTEASVKYFCLGALSSGLLLFGIANIFLMTGTLNFLELRCLFSNLESVHPLLAVSISLVFFGLFYKLSLFPCHGWTPDVYEGVFGPTMLFFSTVVKVSVFSLVVRLFIVVFNLPVFFFFLKPLMLFSACGSIVYGALGALVQTKLRRFLGFTSINQMGFLLLSLASGTVESLSFFFLYLMIYMITVLCFFSILLYLKNSDNSSDIIYINQLVGLSKRHRFISIVLASLLFSMSGVPPLLGFFGKFFILLSVYKSGFSGVLIITLVCNVISAFYYLRLVKCMFFDSDHVGIKFKSKFVYISFQQESNALFFYFFLTTTLIFITVGPYYYLSNLQNFTEILATRCFIIGSL